MRSDDEARGSLGKYETEFAAAVYAANKRFMDDAVSLRPILSTRTQSSALRDCIVHEITTRFRGRPGFNIIEKGQLFLISYKGEWLIRVKKVAPRSKRAMYTRTIQSQLFVNQMQLGQVGFADMPDPATHVHLGYALNKMRTAVDGIYIVCPDGSEVLWSWELAKTSHDAERSVVPIAMSRGAGERPRVTLKQPDVAGDAIDDAASENRR